MNIRSLTGAKVCAIRSLLCLGFLGIAGPVLAIQVGLYRPSNATFYVDYDLDHATDSKITAASGGPVGMAADIDGDGVTDLITYSGGQWYVDTDLDGTANLVFGFGGVPGDIPLAADINGDGHADLIIFRSGTWYIDTNRDGNADQTYIFGAPGDIPLAADMNGDGLADLVLYRNGTWYVDTKHPPNGVPTNTYTFGGLPGDVPFIVDWNGTGSPALGIFRNGTWLLSTQRNGAADVTFNSGTSSDLPISGQFPIYLSSRYLNLCAKYDGTTLNSYMCAGGQTSESWLLLDTSYSPTSTTQRYALKNRATGKCLTASGTNLVMQTCSTSSTTNQWLFTVIADTNNTQWQVQSASALNSCLSNDSVNGYTGSLTLAACASGYYTQEWKRNGSPEIDRPGNTANGSWIGHANFCNKGDPNCVSDGKWIPTDSCEDANHVIRPGTKGCLVGAPPTETLYCGLGGACMWQRGFTPVAGTSTYQFSEVLDKITYSDTDSTNDPVTNVPIGGEVNAGYTNVALTDPLQGSLGGPNDRMVSKQFVLEGRIRINEFQSAGGRARVMLGVQATYYPNWPQLTNPFLMFIEVVPWRNDASYDLCLNPDNLGGGGVTTPCDLLAIYDRRSTFGPSVPGEQVWFTGSQLNRVPNAKASVQVGLLDQSIPPNPQWYSYQIPVSKLFTTYLWTVTPDWSKVRIEGVYIGLEMFGRAKVSIDVDKYRFYQVTGW